MSYYDHKKGYMMTRENTDNDNVIRLNLAEWSELKLILDKVDREQYDPEFLGVLRSLIEKVNKAPLTK